MTRAAPCLRIPGGILRSRPRNLPGKEIADQRDDLVGLVLQDEMAGVEEVQVGVGQVALVGMRTVGGEDLVVLAPDDQRGRAVLAEIGLNGGKELCPKFASSAPPT
jgi:hypothetical protein